MESVRAARLNPFNKNNNASWTTHFADQQLKLNICGNIIQGPSVGFAINDQVVFGIKAPTQGTNTWMLTGSFCDISGRETLRFENNEVITNNGSWDVSFEGPLLTVRSGPREIVAQLAFLAEQQTIEVRRLNMRLANNHVIYGSETGISITGPEISTVIRDISVSYSSGNAFTYGPALTGDFSTLSVNAPRLGKLNDWIINT